MTLSSARDRALARPDSADCADGAKAAGSERGRGGGSARIVRRRTWLYRLAGQKYAQTVSFRGQVTAAAARSYLRHTVGDPLELWARSLSDLKHPFL